MVNNQLPLMKSLETLVWYLWFDSPLLFILDLDPRITFIYTYLYMFVCTHGLGGKNWGCSALVLVESPKYKNMRV